MNADLHSVRHLLIPMQVVQNDLRSLVVQQIRLLRFSRLAPRRFSRSLVPSIGCVLAQPRESGTF